MNCIWDKFASLMVVSHGGKGWFKVAMISCIPIGYQQILVYFRLQAPRASTPRSSFLGVS